ncbi:NUDIX domain-containing protein [Chitinibacter sp. FCG-7]|uniref:NUDIX domain-containing protein n=1 Tax=Chitinibacter mangrovi TaxID=3153927 RepID=A0AAU7FBU7_9NEIS
MKKLTTIIHSAIQSIDRRIMNRRAARAIIVRGDEILLMYTAKHHDYSLPGGGLEKGEDVISALRRELREEVGASDIVIEEYIGYLDEYRPSPRAKFDVVFLRSYCYRCAVKEDFTALSLHHREIGNGVKPVWIKLDEAIAHSEAMLAQTPSQMGISIQRETWLLKFIRTSMRN